MNRSFCVLVLVLVSWTGLSGQAVGGGVSVFVPEELLLKGKGTVAFEQGLSTSIGFGSVFSVPIGFAYHAVGDFVLANPRNQGYRDPELYGDILIPSVQLKAHVGFGEVVYVEAFGGGAAAWAFSLRPTASFASALSLDGAGLAALGNVTLGQGFGLGWVAGGALGVNIGKISVDVGATYRWLRLPLDITATYATGTAGGAMSALETYTSTTNAALLRGLSLQLGGSFTF